MKRLALVVTSALAFLVMAALPALADYGDTTVVHGGGGGKTAFTGANISLGLILVGALVVAGIVALVASRRRASTSE